MVLDQDQMGFVETLELLRTCLVRLHLSPLWTLD